MPTTYKHFLTLSLFTLFLVLPMACTKLVNAPVGTLHNKEMTIDGNMGEVKFEVEVADTEKQRNRGLMGRKTLAEHQGMLFVFDHLSHHSFWMKNTYIPLDLIFFDDKFLVVGTVENAEPLTLRNLTIDKPSRYVLEVRAGTVNKYGIHPGARAHIAHE